MNKTPFILVTVLAAGITFAQESVQSILSDLAAYQGADVVPVLPAADDAMPSDGISMDDMDEASALDISAVIENSRDAYAGGEFERAQAGFEKVISIQPENIVARMYLRKILERDSRRAEVDGMKAVSEAWNTDLVLRSYEVSSSAAEKMELGDADTAMDVTAKFPEVNFPEGASAVYQPRMEKIFVRNTTENLTVLEEILDAMDVAKISADVDQIEIEAKFVEVSEGTLEELGFKWYIENNSIGVNDDVFVDTSANNGLFDDALRSMPFSRPGSLGAGIAAATAGETSWKTFRFEDTFSTTPDQITVHSGGATPLDVVISALDQSTGADVLSAPRVVVRSGETALIRVGELHLYPEVYEPDAQGGNIIHAVYDDWEEKLLGVELSVTPQVDGSYIEMELAPTIIELLGWETHEIAPANSAFSTYQSQVRQIYRHDIIQARLPFFSKRMLETEVTIADGATIAMGGLINEKVEAFEDKVPVLGSLPLVGRLFRSEGERSVKRNLMMFVTAKRVEPTGRISSARSF
jgi:general secretion pathway protein D